MRGTLHQLFSSLHIAMAWRRRARPRGITTNPITSRSLDEFKKEQPLPLGTRIGEIATQNYYLWGLANSIRSKMGADTNQARIANNMKRVAAEAYVASLHVARNAGIPLMSTPPYLPLIEVEVEE